MDGKQLEHVSKFKYLRYELNELGSVQEEYCREVEDEIRSLVKNRGGGYN